MSPGLYTGHEAYWADGHFVAPGKPVFEAGISPVEQAHGIFETFRASVNGIPTYSLHKTRLSWGAGRLFFEPLPDLDIESVFIDLLRRVGLLEGRASLFLYPPGTRPRLLARVAALPDDLESLRAAGISLWPSSYVRGAGDPSCSLKLISRGFLNMALKQAKLRGSDDALLLGEGAEVRETTRANIFALRKDGTLITPTLTDQFLAGITRKRLLEGVRSAGLEVQERTVFMPELLAAKELFVSNAIYGLIPVRELAGHKYGPQENLARFARILDNHCA